MTYKNTVQIFIVAVFAAAISFGVVSHADAAWTSGGANTSTGTCCTTGSTGGTATHTTSSGSITSSGWTSGGANTSTGTCCTTQTPTYTAGTVTYNNGGGNRTVYPAPTCQITVNDSSITAGHNVIVSWSSSNATAGSISNLGTNLPMSGSHTVMLNQTTTFTGTFTGHGKTVHCSKTVTVTQPTPAPTCSISASADSVTAGQAVTISWSSSNATQGSISNLGTNLPMSGSYVVYPSQTTTYTGTFTGNGKTVTCSDTVVVVPPVQYCPAGYTGTYPNCVPPVQYCPAGYTGTYPNCYPPQQNNPSCTITINNYNSNNGYYNPNTAITISWNSTNAQSGYLNQGLGTVSLSGTRTVYPTQTTTYTGTFYGYNGQSVTCSATVYVNNNTYVPPVISNTPYVTLAAVPYTGLYLGPVGTVVYWGFLIFWCALAAYLIVVKRVQNGVYAALKGLLFGTSSTVATAHTAHATHSADAHVSYATPTPRNEDEVDSFVMSQINRARA